MTQDKTSATEKYRCTACGKTFASQEELRAHEKACSGTQRGGQTTRR